MERYIKDGKVGILVSPGFGAGWSTWGAPELAYDKRLVEAFDTGGLPELEKITKELYPRTYMGGADQLQIHWLYPGTQFKIDEYDDSESLELKEDDIWSVA